MNITGNIPASFRGRGRGKGRQLKVVQIQSAMMGPPTRAAPKSRYSASSNIKWKADQKSVSTGNSDVFRTTSSNRSYTTGESDLVTVVAVTEGRGEAKGEVGIAVINVASPSLTLCQISDSQSYIGTLTKINILNPTEILVPSTFVTSCVSNRLLEKLKQQFPHVKINGLARSAFNSTTGLDYIKKLCIPSMNSIVFVLQHRYYALAATAALLSYTEITFYTYYAKESLKIRYEESENSTIIDVTTADKLELVASAVPCTKKRFSCLLNLLNNCHTKIGNRLLRANILQPPCLQKEIESRLDCVTELMERPEMMSALKEILLKVSNIDVLLTLATILPDHPQSCSERQLNYLLTLNTLLEQLEPLSQIFSDSRQSFFVKLRQLVNDPEFGTIKYLVRNMIHNDARSAKGQYGMIQRCFAIKSGLNSVLDLIRTSYSEKLDEMRNYVKDLSDRYGLNLILNNNVKKGYYISLNLNMHQRRTFKRSDIPAEFINVEHLTNSYTMSTHKLINLSYRLEDILSEILKMSNIMIHKLLIKIQKHLPIFYELCESLAKLDMLQSLANASSILHYIRPQFGDYLELVNARHPLLDVLHSKEPVANSIYASKDYNMHIITGPNGSGKSIFIRQIVLIQIMGQLGCFVPAKMATLKLCDRILARVYLEDDIYQDASAFVLEIKDIIYFLNVLTNRTLIIIDELCRSTSIEEGTALAMAICEKLLKTEALVFFTTHFKMLGGLGDLYFNVKKWQLETIVQEKNNEAILKFTYNIIPGVTSLERYGVFLAKTTWPKDTIKFVTDCINSLSTSQTARSINFQETQRAVRFKYNLEAELRMLKAKGQLTSFLVNQKIEEYRQNVTTLGNFFQLPSLVIDKTKISPKVTARRNSLLSQSSDSDEEPPQSPLQVTVEVHDTPKALSLLEQPSQAVTTPENLRCDMRSPSQKSKDVSLGQSISLSGLSQNKSSFFKRGDAESPSFLAEISQNLIEANRSGVSIDVSLPPNETMLNIFTPQVLLNEQSGNLTGFSEIFKTSINEALNNSFAPLNNENFDKECDLSIFHETTQQISFFQRKSVRDEQLSVFNDELSRSTVKNNTGSRRNTQQNVSNNLIFDFSTIVIDTNVSNDFDLSHIPSESQFRAGLQGRPEKVSTPISFDTNNNNSSYDFTNSSQIKNNFFHDNGRQNSNSSSYDYQHALVKNLFKSRSNNNESKVSFISKKDTSNTTKTNCPVSSRLKNSTFSSNFFSKSANKTETLQNSNSLKIIEGTQKELTNKNIKSITSPSSTPYFSALEQNGTVKSNVNIFGEDTFESQSIEQSFALLADKVGSILERMSGHSKQSVGSLQDVIICSQVGFDEINKFGSREELNRDEYEVVSDEKSGDKNETDQGDICREILSCETKTLSDNENSLVREVEIEDNYRDSCDKLSNKNCVSCNNDVNLSGLRNDERNEHVDNVVYQINIFDDSGTHKTANTNEITLESLGDIYKEIFSDCSNESLSKSRQLDILETYVTQMKQIELVKNIRQNKIEEFIKEATGMENNMVNEQGLEGIEKQCQSDKFNSGSIIQQTNKSGSNQKIVEQEEINTDIIEISSTESGNVQVNQLLVENDIQYEKLLDSNNFDKSKIEEEKTLLESKSSRTTNTQNEIFTPVSKSSETTGKKKKFTKRKKTTFVNTSTTNSEDYFVQPKSKKPKFSPPIKRSSTPVSSLSEKDIERIYFEQNKTILERNDAYECALEIINRPSVRHLKQMEHIVSVRKTDSGIVVVPDRKRNYGGKRKFLPPLKRPTSNFDFTIFSDRNSDRFDQLFLTSDRSSNGAFVSSPFEFVTSPVIGRRDGAPLSPVVNFFEDKVSLFDSQNLFKDDQAVGENKNVEIPTSNDIDTIMNKYLSQNVRDIITDITKENVFSSQHSEINFDLNAANFKYPGSFFD